MRIRIACFCGMFFVAGAAFGQKSLDALGWNDLGKANRLARTMYVRGYVNGYADGDSAMEQIVAVVFKDQDLQTAFKKMPADPQIFRVVQMVGLGKNRDISVAKVRPATQGGGGWCRRGVRCADSGNRCQRPGSGACK